jgi:hypothetical protein
MSSRRARFLLAVGLLASLAASVTVAETTGATATPKASAATASPGLAVEIIPPDEPWAGATRAEWIARSWQWALSLPVDVSPVVDQTGELCGYGQSGPLFFLTGSTSSVDKRCVVAQGTAILVNVSGINCSTIEPPPYFGRDEQELRACAIDRFDTETLGYTAAIDQREITGLEAYRTGTPLFTLTIPANNIYEVEAGIGNAVAEVVAFIIAPPPPGEYQITWTTTFYGAADPLENAATVIVEAPGVAEPPPSL